MYCGDVRDFLDSPAATRYNKKVRLVLTSPPFPLNRKKKYGNLSGERYLAWLADFAPHFAGLLSPGGSIVIEVGNAWEPGRPVMSTLGLEALLAFKKCGHLNLIQQFVAYNPARLPGPAQWVNVERIRVKDAFTHIWWFARSVRPRADNRNVLKPYSRAMRDLLATRTYNSGKRPSGHSIGTSSFLKDNGGSIPSNVLVASNTTSSDEYQEHCRRRGRTPHPARMQDSLAEFFIRFLTREGDLVFDPFAGSNTTGAVAERLGRRWVSVEVERDYVRDSLVRFAT